MNDYPRMLYKSGGTNPEPVHGTVLGTKTVYSATDEDEASADGWFRTTAEAVDAALPKDQTENVPDPTIEVSDDEKTDQANALMTREEMEAKANEIHLAFDPRITDRKLRKALSEVLSSQADHK